jgi:hypothetical protein
MDLCGLARHIGTAVWSTRLSVVSGGDGESSTKEEADRVGKQSL